MVKEKVAVKASVVALKPRSDEFVTPKKKDVEEKKVSKETSLKLLTILNFQQKKHSFQIYKEYTHKNKKSQSKQILTHLLTKNQNLKRMRKGFECLKIKSLNKEVTNSM